jgi:hypothetical protein
MTMREHERDSAEPRQPAPEGPRFEQEHGGAERPAAALERRAETLKENADAFDADVAAAAKLVEQLRDPEVRAAFEARLAGFRTRSSGIGGKVRAAVAGIALFAGGINLGYTMGEAGRRDEAVKMAKESGEAQARAKMLEERLAERGANDAAAADGAKREADGARRERSAAMETLKGENKELRAQVASMMEEVKKLRDERDALGGQVLAEKEKGLQKDDVVRKRDFVTANMQAIFDKMRSMIEHSDDPKLKKDLQDYMDELEQ